MQVSFGVAIILTFAFRWWIGPASIPLTGLGCACGGIEKLQRLVQTCRRRSSQPAEMDQVMAAVDAEMTLC